MAPPRKSTSLYRAKNSEQATELDFTYFNAVYTVENALSKVKDEKGMKRVEKFLKQEPCPDCGGTRLSEQARAPRIQGLSLDRGLPDDAFPILPSGWIRCPLPFPRR